MARISGINIPTNKRVQIGLTYVKGIGKSTSNKILSLLKINKDQKVEKLSKDDLSKIRSYIEDNCLVEGELRRSVMTNIKRLKDIRSYRGNRHSNHLPCRGQRTRYNARTTRRLGGKGSKLAVAGSSMKKIKAAASEKT